VTARPLCPPPMDPPLLASRISEWILTFTTGAGVARVWLAQHLLTRSVRLARMILIQAIRNAMVNDLVVRNVADLAVVPTGKPGRPSRSLNTEQDLALLDAAKGRTPVALRRHEYVQAPAPPGYAYRCHRARSAVREQRKDQRRPKLNR
jgi:hypothetical protein